MSDLQPINSLRERVPRCQATQKEEGIKLKRKPRAQLLTEQARPRQASYRLVWIVTLRTFLIRTPKTHRSMKSKDQRHRATLCSSLSTTLSCVKTTPYSPTSKIPSIALTWKDTVNLKRSSLKPVSDTSRSAWSTSSGLLRFPASKKWPLLDLLLLKNRRLRKKPRWKNRNQLNRRSWRLLPSKQEERPPKNLNPKSAATRVLMPISSFQTWWASAQAPWALSLTY